MSRLEHPENNHRDCYLSSTFTLNNRRIGVQNEIYGQFRICRGSLRKWYIFFWLKKRKPLSVHFLLPSESVPQHLMPTMWTTFSRTSGFALECRRAVFPAVCHNSPPSSAWTKEFTIIKFVTPTNLSQSSIYFVGGNPFTLRKLFSACRQGKRGLPDDWSTPCLPFFSYPTSISWFNPQRQHP